MAAGLDQAVGAEHQRLAGFQGEPGRRIVPVRVDAQRQPARRRPHHHRAVGHPDRRMRVPGTGDLQRPGHRVCLHVHAGREAEVGHLVVVRDAVQEPGRPGEHGVRAVALGGVGAQRDAQLAHEPRGPYVMALDVPHDQGEPAGGQRDQVVPVAADLESAAGRDVPGGHIHAGDLRAERGQHGALQSLRQLPLRLRGTGPGERLGEHPGHRRQDGPLVGCERHRIGEGRQPGTHRAPGRRQRQEGPGAAAEGLGERPGRRIALLVLLGRGQVHRAARADDLGGRVVRGQRHVREGAQVARLVPVLADDRQPVALHPEHHEPVRREARHRQAAGHPQHLRRGPCLGQRPARVQQERLPRAPPVTGDRAAGGPCARGRLGDLLEGADQFVRPPLGIEGRLGPAADHPQDVPAAVHDPDAYLRERALVDRQRDHAGDLVPVLRVQAGPGLGLREGGRLRGQAEQPRRLRIHGDQTGARVPAP